ncbi:MAG: DUF1016 N-terminal domain-containing protein [Tannerella sp.]|jgi:predicted nuclease of restriction endonuclease-like (RecB) superfamily|nr:DUF1016 N-terminal domain-containing protein [Tannerella sp.]
MDKTINLSEYSDWLYRLKQQIKTGQIKAALSVNSQMILLYWDMGRQIAEKQENAKWGSGFIEQLSKDLREEFPEMAGLSKDNLFMMKRFYLFYAQMSENIIIAQPVQQLENNNQFVAQVVQQIQNIDNQRNIILEQIVRKFALVPWGHHTTILRKIKDPKQALFYINKTIENNWSRAVLEYQIEREHKQKDKL